MSHRKGDVHGRLVVDKLSPVVRSDMPRVVVHVPNLKHFGMLQVYQHQLRIYLLPVHLGSHLNTSWIDVETGSEVDERLARE